MNKIACPLDGLFLYEAKKFGDYRGYFFESFRHDFFKDHIDEKVHFVQDNVSKSTKGTLRGLHFQAPPFAQAKLVHVVEGEVFDVAVDIRKDSLPLVNGMESTYQVIMLDISISHMALLTAFLYSVTRQSFLINAIIITISKVKVVYNGMIPCYRLPGQQ